MIPFAIFCPICGPLTDVQDSLRWCPRCPCGVAKAYVTPYESTFGMVPIRMAK